MIIVRVTTSIQIIPNINNSPILFNKSLEGSCNCIRDHTNIPYIMRVKIKPMSKPIKKFILLDFGDIDLEQSFRYQAIHTIRGTLSIESLYLRI